jgi:hypothetical protein
MSDVIWFLDDDDVNSNENFVYNYWYTVVYLKPLNGPD